MSLLSKTGNCDRAYFGGSDTFTSGIRSSARIKAASLLSVCFVLIKSLKTDLVLCLNTWCITNICSYTTYRILVIALSKLPVFNEIGELKNPM